MDNINIDITEVVDSVNITANETVDNVSIEIQESINGKEIELQTNATHIQWRYINEIAWTNLIPLSDLKGDQGEQGIQGIQGITGDTGEGVIAGGDEGLSLVKKSDSDYDTEWDVRQKYLSAGPSSQCVVTENGNGNFDIGSITCNLYDNANYLGQIKQYTVPALLNQTIPENIVTYIAVYYNNGTPEFRLIFDNTLINHSDIINVGNLFWEKVGSIDENHIFFTGIYGNGLPNKTSHRLIHTERFGFESGLGISEYNIRNLRIEPGVLWYDSEEIKTKLILTDTLEHEIHFYYHVSGNWTCSKISTYNNTQYDNGTDLQSLTGNKYTINWLYRCVNDTDYCTFLVLGDQAYTLLQTEAAQPPDNLPGIINKQGILIGRIIVKNGQNTATSIESSFSKVFTGSSVINHDDLSDLSGAGPEYNHLNNTQYGFITNSLGGTTGQILTKKTNTDYVIHNGLTQVHLI